ncbi:MAG: PASTA domain-containing protein, partial [Syntrophomonadaceae bacterium]
AYMPGYRAAGKTGTAQKIAPTGGYMANEYVASFIGFAPADDPQLVCIVVVDAPQGYPYYGGWVAAPVFKTIMEDSLRYLDVPQREEIDSTSPPTPEKVQVLVPDVVNLPLAEALSTIKERGLSAKVTGEGNIVWQQTPKAKTKIDLNSEVIIYLSPFEQNGENTEVTIPDLQGKSMKEVAKILADLGLHLLPEGFGLAYEQTPAAGKVVTSGSNIRVKFQPVGE